MKLTLKPCLKCKKEVFRDSKVERKDTKNKAETGFKPRSWKSDHTLEMRVPPRRTEPPRQVKFQAHHAHLTRQSRITKGMRVCGGS